MTLKTLLDAVDRQEHIICVQSEIIDELYELLALHLSSEEISEMSATRKIELAARLRNDT